jgi:hypothetical protein
LLLERRGRRGRKRSGVEDSPDRRGKGGAECALRGTELTLLRCAPF